MSTEVIVATNVFSTLFIFLAYVPCLKVIGFDPEIKDRSCFRIMYHLGVSDLLLLILQFSFALLTLVGVADEIPIEVNGFVAPFLCLCWVTSTFFLFLLALNRWAVITSNNLFQEWLFSNKGTSVLISLTWLYGLAWMACLQTPSVDYYYYPQTITFYFGMDNNTATEWAKDLNWLNNQIFLCPAALLYLLAFIRARSERKSLGPLPDEQAELDESLAVTERRLLKQGAVIFFYTWLGSQYWHGAPFLIGVGFTNALAFGNWLWISTAGINPGVYLFMNNTIRNKVFEQFGWSTTTVRQEPTRGPSHTATRSRGHRTNENQAVVEENL